MTARQDYPAIAAKSRERALFRDGPSAEGRECARALDEIDRLRRWKAEATEVIATWETQVADIFDFRPEDLGRDIPSIVHDEVLRMRETIAFLRSAPL